MLQARPQQRVAGNEGDDVVDRAVESVPVAPSSTEHRRGPATTGRGGRDRPSGPRRPGRESASRKAWSGTLESTTTCRCPRSVHHQVGTDPPVGVHRGTCSSKSQCSSMPAISTTRRNCISPHRPRVAGDRNAVTRLLVSRWRRSCDSVQLFRPGRAGRHRPLAGSARGPASLFRTSPVGLAAGTRRCSIASLRCRGPPWRPVASLFQPGIGELQELRVVLSNALTESWANSPAICCAAPLRPLRHGRLRPARSCSARPGGPHQLGPGVGQGPGRLGSCLCGASPPIAPLPWTRRPTIPLPRSDEKSDNQAAPGVQVGPGHHGTQMVPRSFGV